MGSGMEELERRKAERIKELSAKISALETEKSKYETFKTDVNGVKTELSQIKTKLQTIQSNWVLAYNSQMSLEHLTKFGNCSNGIGKADSDLDNANTKAQEKIDEIDKKIQGYERELRSLRVW